MQKLAALHWRQAGLVLALLGEPQDVRREVLERALEVPLEAADGVDAGVTNARGAVKHLERMVGPRGAQRNPFARRSRKRRRGQRLLRQRLVKEDARAGPR